MRIASGSALFVACLVVASSANGKSENSSVTAPPRGSGRRVASLGSHKKRGLYGDLSIGCATENVEIRKVTPLLDRLPSRPRSKGLESTSDRPREPLEDFIDESIGNSSSSLEDLCTWAAPPAKGPNTTKVRVRSDQHAFPSDLCSLEPSVDVHVYPPLYSGPPNSPLMGPQAFSLTTPPLSRALAHCSTSLSIWCSENQRPTDLEDSPGTCVRSSTPHHDCVPTSTCSTSEAVISKSVDQEGIYEGNNGANGSVGTHIVDGGWVSNLVQTLSS